MQAQPERWVEALIQAIDAADELTLELHSSMPEPCAWPGRWSLGGGRGCGVAVGKDVVAAIDSFDVVIDFTVPEATLALAQACAQNNKAMVIGTTGFSEQQLQSCIVTKIRWRFSPHRI
ncbi:MAG: hypothetical protein CM15mP120_23540 [Pseudomonadota bacterium]|nr:MAG: hypothetical protein CM15mP120_23540 [Pseudomonadota bacterium]